jgi:hypothetical protein
MQDLSGLKSPTPRNLAPMLMLVLAATMIGSSLGILIADRDAFSDLKIRVAGQVATKSSTPQARTKSEADKDHGLSTAISQAQEDSELIETGLKILGPIRYSTQVDSTRVAFDLEDMNLIRTGLLASPNRVFVDLQDSHGGKGSRKLIKAQKTLSIDGDLIFRVRIAHWDSGALRIVLDLKRSCNFTYRIPQGSPSRLILELRPHISEASGSKMK